VPTIIMICCILSGCSEPPLPTVHELLRQHILEAELGSAISISFAKKPAVPLPDDEIEVVGRAAATLVRIKQHSLKPVRKSLDTINQNQTKTQRHYLYAVPGYVGNRADISKLEKSMRTDTTSVAVVTESLSLIKRDSASIN
jgi:hypothetical protein